jgi:SAM-dependent methyltransferase
VIFDVLANRCGLGEDASVLEIGPGTGQATAALLERGAFPLIAVEPDPGFASYLARRFGAYVDVRNIPFEELDIPARSISIAASATAWHWVEQEQGLGKLAHVLKPGGWWAAWWTAFHDPLRHDPLSEALSPLLSRLPSPDVQGGYAAPAEFAFDTEARIQDLDATGAFVDLNIQEFRWTLDLDPRGARALYGTFSRIVGLPGNMKDRVLGMIERVVEGRFGGSVSLPVVTILYTARRA